MTASTTFLEKLFQLPNKLGERIHRRGIGDVVGWSFYQVSWRWREWRMGAPTSEFSNDLVVGDDGECNGYEPIDYRCFDKVMKALAPISPNDQFLDYGCGMGRAVLLAAMRPYGRVLGIEIDKRLAQIARQQISTLRQHGMLKATDVEIIEADAARYEVPAKVNHIFLFNSFTGDLLQQTLQQIHESVKRDPRELKIVYIQPIIDEDTLASLPWLKLEAELSTGYWMHVRSRLYVVRLEPTQSLDSMGNKAC